MSVELDMRPAIEQLIGRYGHQPVALATAHWRLQVSVARLLDVGDERVTMFAGVILSTSAQVFEAAVAGLRMDRAKVRSILLQLDSYLASQMSEIAQSDEQEIESRQLTDTLIAAVKMP